MKLYREHGLGYCTQYAELKERAMSEGPLLPGTPGALVERSKPSGRSYWYRVYSPAPGVRPAEDYVCAAEDSASHDAMRLRMEFASWCAREVSMLGKIGFQVADKRTARVLVELRNHDLFEGGLVLVGTLAFMAWLNELGATIPQPARTMDIDVARYEALSLAAPLSLLATLQATGLPFNAVPGFPSHAPSTSMKLPGADGLRVDLLAPARKLGALVSAPDLQWAAQGIPFFEYVLEHPVRGAVLAGGHCIPVGLPRVARYVWHKLYSSTQRAGFPAKALKDRRQALTLGAVLVEKFPSDLDEALEEAPRSMVKPVKALLPALVKEASEHPELIEMLESTLGRVR